MNQGSAPRFVLRKAAIQDLDELAAYIQQESPETAVRFLDAANETFHLLAENPELGGLFETTHQLLAGIRIWRVKGFQTMLVFYRPITVGVEIVRLLHGARDFAAIFRPDD